MTKMEFEVISKMKKTDGTNQLKVINDFKQRVIKFGKKKAELQNKIDAFYGEEPLNSDEMLNKSDVEKDVIKVAVDSFMEQFAFKEPVLKRKRKELEPKPSKVKSILKDRNESINKDRHEFHKSLNICKDNLELEMMFEDPNDKKNQVKKGKLE
jgi:hypothetical protein